MKVSLISSKVLFENTSRSYCVKSLFKSIFALCSTLVKYKITRFAAPTAFSLA